MIAGAKGRRSLSLSRKKHHKQKPMPNRQERTACLRRPAQESAQPGCSTEPSSTAEPLDPQKAVQSCQAFYDNCNAAQRADLRNMWAEILDARERQPSGSFLEKQGYQRQLAKRQKEMARVTGNDIEGQLQYAFKKDPELAQNALRILRQALAAFALGNGDRLWPQHPAHAPGSGASSMQSCDSRMTDCGSHNHDAGMS